MWEELQILLLPGVPTLYLTTELVWVFAVGCIGLVVVAFGIGANDVANSFGTSVGSGALTPRHALIIAGIMEFAGAVALGDSVAHTIRTGITNENCFSVADSPELMLGMLCTLLAAGSWILVASFWGLPISTTHTIVGGVIGFTIASQGWQCVKWGFTGFAGIATSWIISPLFAGAIGAAMHVLVMKFIVKAEDPMTTGYRSVHFLFTLSMLIVSGLIFFKTPLSKSWAPWVSWVVVGSISLGALITSLIVGVKLLTLLVELRINWEKKHEGELEGEPTEATALNIRQDRFVDLEPDLQDPLPEEELKERIAKEDEVGRIFCVFQVFSAALQSFAHGANDTANAIGPWATIYYFYTLDPAYASHTPIWGLAVGAVAIVAGLALFGSRVMETMATGITKVNFVRGFSIEYSSMLAVIIASRLGFPISTTHCKVGSVVFVGLMNKFLYRFPGLAPAEPQEDAHDVDWGTILEIALSWLLTVPLSALGTAGLFSLFVQVLIKSYPLGELSNSTQNFTNVTLF